MNTLYASFAMFVCVCEWAMRLAWRQPFGQFTWTMLQMNTHTHENSEVPNERTERLKKVSFSFENYANINMHIAHIRDMMISSDAILSICGTISNFWREFHTHCMALYTVYGMTTAESFQHSFFDSIDGSISKANPKGNATMALKLARKISNV